MISAPISLSTLRRRAALALAICSGLTVQPLAGQHPSATLTVIDDSARQELALVLGPLHLPARASHHDVVQAPWRVGQVPFNGWLHGFRTELATADGRPVPARVIHHINLIDLDRRALLAPIANRMLAVGQETKPASLPSSFGYPVRRGQTLGLFTGLHNPTANDYHGVYLRLVLSYTRGPARPAPRAIYSVWFDAKLEPGTRTGFDLPQGESSRSQDFVAPISGSVLALGGHLHDYGLRLTLEDVTTGEMLYDVSPETDSAGHVRSVPVQLYLEQPLRLIGGHTYRITGYYRNPTGRTIPEGGMGTIGGVFIPDSGERWPALDRSHPLYVADMNGLEAGHGGVGRAHGAHGDHH